MFPRWRRRITGGGERDLGDCDPHGDAGRDNRFWGGSHASRCNISRPRFSTPAAWPGRHAHGFRRCGSAATCVRTSKLCAPDRPRLRRVPHRVSATDAVRAALQDRRLHARLRHRGGESKAGLFAVSDQGQARRSAGQRTDHRRVGAAGVGPGHLELHPHRDADGYGRRAVPEAQRQYPAGAGGEHLLRRRHHRSHRCICPGDLQLPAVRPAAAASIHLGPSRRAVRQHDEHRGHAGRVRSHRQQQSDGPGSLEFDAGLGLSVRGHEPCQYAGRQDAYRSRLRRAGARRRRLCLHQRPTLS